VIITTEGDARSNNSGKGSLQALNGAAVVVQAANSQAVHTAAAIERSVR
jgi:hypothetical protein